MLEMRSIFNDIVEYVIIISFHTLFTIYFYGRIPECVQIFNSISYQVNISDCFLELVHFYIVQTIPELWHMWAQIKVHRQIVLGQCLIVSGQPIVSTLTRPGPCNVMIRCQE